VNYRRERRKGGKKERRQEQKVEVSKGREEGK
jgi:hypothetical protein